MSYTEKEITSLHSLERSIKYLFLLTAALATLWLQTSAYAGFPYPNYNPPYPSSPFDLGGYSKLSLSFENPGLSPPIADYDEAEKRLCLRGKVVGFFSDQQEARAVYDIVGDDELGQDGLCFTGVEKNSVEKNDFTCPNSLDGCFEERFAYTSTVENDVGQSALVSGRLVINIADTEALFISLTGRFADYCTGFAPDLDPNDSTTGWINPNNNVTYDPNNEIEDLAICNIDIGIDDTFPLGMAESCEAAFPATSSPFGFDVGECELLHFEDQCVSYPVVEGNDPLGLLAFRVYADLGVYEPCDGIGLVARVCHNGQNPDGDPSCFDTNAEGDFTTGEIISSVMDVDPGYATVVCLGSDVADWLNLSTYVGQEIFIVPCEPGQELFQVPFKLTQDTVEFTSSEGDGAVIEDLAIVGIGTGDEQVVLSLQESPDKTASIWDFSLMDLINIDRIEGLELPDTITGSAGTDVILGGNGNDVINGFEGNDCLDGEQNNDVLTGGAGADVFVLTDKLGKDVITDYSPAQGDVIVNISRTSPTVSCTGNTCTVTIKGQNFVTVTVEDGALTVEDIDTQSTLGSGPPDTDYKQCAGHPAYIPTTN